MGGGGKGGSKSAPVQPQYVDPVNGMSFTDSNPFVKDGADKLNAEIAQRTANEKTNSDALAQAAKDKAAQDETDFQSRAGAAKQSALGDIRSYFQTQGIDPTQFDPQITQAVDSASQAVPDLDPAPRGKYAPTLASDLFNNLQSGRQATTLRNFNNEFSPSYSQTAIPDSLISSHVADIVNAQLDPLSSQLQNAQKRGTLNDQGYAAALKSLGDARTKATSTVTSLANGVLAKDRGDLDSYLGTGRSAAGTVPLGTNFDDSSYLTGAQTRSKQATDAFGGDLSNAVGSAKFADLTQLLNAGGNVQGASDPTAANPVGGIGPNGAPIPGGAGDLSPSAIAQAAMANEKRGLGTTGAY